MNITYKKMNPSDVGSQIHAFSSPSVRALTVGYIQKSSGIETFVPARLNFGVPRMKDTFEATKESLLLPPIQDILSQYKPQEISTITLLRETISCQLNIALYETGTKGHYGDAYIGATHIKGEGAIKTAYLYENTEGLVPDGLWVIGESFCIGRNLAATMDSLLSKFTPREILFIAPLASRRAINTVGAIIAKKNIPTTYVAWGGLFGVDEKTLYDMPWGHKDTEPVDTRDKDLFISIYSPALCVGGDFGNNYYSPPLSKALYDDQLKEHAIIPKIPSVSDVLKIYKTEELVSRE